MGLSGRAARCRHPCGIRLDGTSGAPDAPPAGDIWLTQTGGRRLAHNHMCTAANSLTSDGAFLLNGTTDSGPAGAVAKNTARKFIQAAGGIVIRDGARPRFAVVQRSKDDAWVLPRGKLKRDENPVAGARREVIEETGHRVRVGEFLGAITYRAQGRSKVVQFWYMQAEAKPSRKVMADIVAVEWLPLKAAVRRLSYPLEKLFLRNIGRRAMPHPKRHERKKTPRKPARKSALKKSNKKAKKSTSRGGSRTNQKRPRAHKTASRAAKVKSRPRQTAVVRKTVVRKKQRPPKRAAPAQAAAVHTTPIRTTGIASMQSSPERVIASAAAKPVPAASRKTILQRVLGRLAG